MRLLAAFRAVVLNEDGGTFAEYAMIAGLLAAVMITGVGILQTNAAAVLSGTSTGWQNMAQTPP